MVFVRFVGLHETYDRVGACRFQPVELKKGIVRLSNARSHAQIDTVATAYSLAALAPHPRQHLLRCGPVVVRIASWLSHLLIKLRTLQPVQRQVQLEVHHAYQEVVHKKGQRSAAFARDTLDLRCKIRGTVLPAEARIASVAPLK
jgi:hypothetical protein